MNLEAICRWTLGLYFDAEHQSQSHNKKSCHGQSVSQSRQAYDTPAEN